MKPSLKETPSIALRNILFSLFLYNAITRADDSSVNTNHIVPKLLSENTNSSHANQSALPNASIKIKGKQIFIVTIWKKS